MSTETVRSKLEWYCYVHQPQNIAKLDAILTAYRGREAEMMAALREKYGPQPTETDAYRARLQRFFAHYNPDKLSSVDEILRVYDGPRRSQLFPALEAKYGPEAESLPTAKSGTKPPPPASVSTPEASRASFGNDTRSRLVRFMEKYNREKLGSIDTILAAYAGREAEMFAALVKKYGPEPPAAGEESPPRAPESKAPPPPSPPAAASAATSAPPGRSLGEVGNDTRSRLVRFMEKYNREKLGSIDTILAAYAGREAEMFAALVKKYGPEPEVGSSAAAPAAAADPLTDFLHARKLTAMQVLEDFPLNDVITSLSKAFGAPKQSSERTTRARLERFFQHYNRDKLASLDAVLNAYAGRETDLFEALVRKYGPEPPAPASQASGSAAAASTVQEFLSSRGIDSTVALEAIFPTKKALMDYLKSRYGDHAGRLRRLFVRYAPELLPTADSLLKESANTEEQLLAKYVRQLGPEPPSDAPDRIVTLFSRRHDRGNVRFDDMNAVDDESATARDTAEGSSLEPPSVVKEGYVLMKDSDKAPPGDYSGDESKAFPGDEEQWLQLVIGDLSALDASPSAGDLRRRTYSEFAGEMSDGEASPTSPRFNDEEEAPASPAKTSPRPASTANFGVRVKSKLGVDVADLCSDCSKQLAHAFDALWQPVGPGHRKALSSSTTKEGFLEKLSGARMGAKWQRRYFRVNDKGIHYFETNLASEKPKGYKVLTRRSVLRPVVDPKTNLKCSDPNFAYFSVTCNETNEDFLLRADSAEERASWVEFFKAALERAKLSVVGQDPIPARWRARVSGLKLSTSELILQTNESFAEARRLNSLRDALRLQVEEEKAQLEVMEARRVEVAKQRDHLTKSLAELGEMVAAAEHDAEMSCLNLAEAAAETALKREALDQELRTARQRVQETTREMVAIEKEVVVLEHDRDREQLRLHQVFQRWRNIEQRQKSPFSLR